MTTLYGIRNCDSVRKARRWLLDRGIEYRFHDLRDDGLGRTRLNGWVSALGWEALLNRRGTTWRRLPQSTRDGIDRTAAMRIMLEHPAIIRRPLLEHGGQLHVGFSEADYAALFQGSDRT